MKTIMTKAAFFESDSSRVELKRNGQVLQPDPVSTLRLQQKYKHLNKIFEILDDE